jgi:hypothetical protein
MSSLIPFSGDGFLGFGTFPDGTPYATGRGLAAMCGVDESTIRGIGQYVDIKSSKPNTREFKIIKNLSNLKYNSSQLYYEIIHESQPKPINAYPESVCIAILKYYAYQAGDNCTEEAETLSDLLMQKSFREFVYEIVGYKQAPKASFNNYVLSRILHHHNVDKMPLPDGYFCLFDKMVEVLQNFDLKIDYVLQDQWYDYSKGDVRFLEPDISLGRRFSQLFTSNFLEKQDTYNKLYQERIAQNPKKFWTQKLIDAKWELEKAIAEKDLRIKYIKIDGIDPSLPIPESEIHRTGYKFNPSPDSNRDPKKLPPAYCYSNDYTSLFYEWLRDVFFKYVWRDYILERDSDGWMQKYNKFKSFPIEKQNHILQTAEGKMISGFEYRELWEKQLPPGGDI